MDKKTQTLTDTEEMLLGKVFDNEASFFERITARRLLNRAPAAQHYLDSLKRMQAPLREALPLKNPSLWMRVSARLYAEERSELLLGKRAVSKESSLLDFFGTRTMMSGGLAATLAAVVLFIVIPKNSQNSAMQSPTYAGAAVEPLAIQRGVPIAMPASVGVDWMRSDGRLQVMHDPDEKAPLIFVKRRYNRVGPIYRTERNSQGVVMQENSRSASSSPS